jgi:hypothetical protein
MMAVMLEGADNFRLGHQLTEEKANSSKAVKNIKITENSR